MVRRTVTLLLVVASLVSGYNNSEHCAELNPQPQVDIEQIMGMWYGIEIISHNADAKHEVVYEEGCPILYLSDYTSPFLYSDTDYKRPVYTRYDERHYETTPPPDQEPYWYTTPNTLYGLQYEKSGNYQRRHKDIKRLRILWDDSGSTMEYTARYNVSQAGFWISSGPQNGSDLDAKVDHFTGTIQVLKAVGNHLVLVFCNRLPDPQLFTVLLSRVLNVNRHEVHGVHNMLTRRGLSTASVRKVCTTTNSSTSIRRQ